MNMQLPLNLRLRDSSSFDNFLTAGNNELLESLVSAVRAAGDAGARDTQVIYLWGESGCGKSHLLEAVLRKAQERELATAYLPLARAKELSPALVEDMESIPLVCIDDIQSIAGLEVWESALFSLYERARAAEGATLIVAATAPPAQLGLKLPDLATRLGWGLVYFVRVLNDAEKLAAIRLRARNRGMDISPGIARYLLERYPRDMHSLFDLLDRIDEASLARQRRITIPFLKELDREARR